ncbi:hypothetical protein BSL78_15781 [Apostichopus japonicus]|uniref:Uncharacterized protein n=1 Tax=Stichopus japonicus TaxID=307972 RepID=A0A2G8KHD1_STIJA|nr:hypothetical protein BSL78_15781 [Apostichopus japonicus]
MFVSIDDNSDDHGKPLLFEDNMLENTEGRDTKENEVPMLDEDQENEIHEETVNALIDGESKEEEGEGEEEDDSIYYSNYDSLPSWYIDQLLLTDSNDSLSNTKEYQAYKSELDQLILDVKLYQVYHSIKTLKSVLDDLLEDERNDGEEAMRGQEEEAEKQEAEEDSEKEEEEEALSRNILKEADQIKGDSQSLKALTDREALIAKQLEALKEGGHKERSSRRIKRDLSFDDDLTRDIGESEWNDGKPNLRWMVKFDDENDGYRDIPDEDDGFDDKNEFDLTKGQIQDVLSTFFPTDGDSYLPGNEVNINVGDQSLSQEIWYPSKRGFRRSDVDRNFVARLPTLEGMRKRRRTYIPLRRSRNEKSILDSYFDDAPTMSQDREMLIRNQIAKLAQRLAQNTPRRPNGMTPLVRDFTNGPAGDVNMWFENNPMYNIGVDDNIGDTFGWMEMDLPRTSPDRVAHLQQTSGRSRDWGHHTPRLQRRSRIVEEPSLPGPYQGYFMEGQLWHDVLNKRSAPSLGLKPKNLKIGGPNAWGNFIFINDKGALPSDGELFAQSFGDNIGNNEKGPTEIETEGMWDDGEDDTKNKESWALERIFIQLGLWCQRKHHGRLLPTLGKARLNVEGWITSFA